MNVMLVKWMWLNWEKMNWFDDFTFFSLSLFCSIDAFVSMSSIQKMWEILIVENLSSLLFLPSPTILFSFPFFFHNFRCQYSPSDFLSHPSIVMKNQLWTSPQFQFEAASSSSTYFFFCSAAYLYICAHCQS